CRLISSGAEKITGLATLGPAPMKEQRDDLPNRAFANEIDSSQAWFAFMPETNRPERTRRSKQAAVELTRRAPKARQGFCHLDRSYTRAAMGPYRRGATFPGFAWSRRRRGRPREAWPGRLFCGI